MLARKLRSQPRPLEEITELIEVYPVKWRNWCNGPETEGCACMGCVRQPAPSTVRGDPEYAAWPNEEDALIQEEVQLYLEKNPPPPRGGAWDASYKEVFVQWPHKQSQPGDWMLWHPTRKW